MCVLELEVRQLSDEGGGAMQARVIATLGLMFQTIRQGHTLGMRSNYARNLHIIYVIYFYMELLLANCSD